MKLDEALRCLLLRNLRERQTEAMVRGQIHLAKALTSLADDLQVTRDRKGGAYVLAIKGKGE